MSIPSRDDAAGAGGEKAHDTLRGEALDVRQLELRAENLVSAERARFRLLADALPVSIAYLSSGLRFVYCNATYEKLNKVARTAVEGKHAEEILGKAAYALMRPRMEAALLGQQQSFDYQTACETGIGHNLHVDYLPDISTEGAILGFFVVVSDEQDKKQAEDRAREALEQYEALTHVAFGGVAMSENGVFLNVSERFASSLGYERTELIGQPIGNVVTPAALRIITEKIQRGDEEVYEAVALRKDGTTFPVEICGVNAHHEGRRVRVVAARSIEGRVSLETDIIEVSSREQARIGQDLHDDLGQLLTGVALTLRTLQEGLIEERSGQLGTANDLANLVERAISRTRQISHSLAPVLDGYRGLADALQHLADDIASQGSVSCSFTDNCQQPIADPEAATHLYRIAQEAVNNAIRHGSATLIDVICGYHDDVVYLTIDDNGTGFFPAEDPPAGLGIKTMRYRSRVLGGTLEITRRSTAGMSVLCTCPLPVSHAP